MTINTSQEAIANALRQTRNVPGTCQLTVRTWFNAPSVGDQDGDGDADAVDGWKSEPAHARHPGDRNPPNGKPIAFSGGGSGFGHRALAVPSGIRSTDMYGNRYKAGVTSTVTASTKSEAITIIERSMGVKYLGWSETIDGYPIPEAEKPVPVPPKPRPSGDVIFETRVASNNLMSLPRNPRLKETIASTNTIPLVGFQEADPKEYKQALKRRFPSIIGVNDETIDNNTYSTPIHANMNRFRRIKTGTRKLYNGVKDVSLTRRLTWAHLEDRKSKQQFGIINIHAVRVFKDGKYQVRLALRAQCKTALKAQVDYFRKLNIPIIVTGDFNDTAAWLGVKYDNMRVQRVTHGFDQILLVDSPKAKWHIDRSNHADTPSDHDVLRAQVALLKR